MNFLQVLQDNLGGIKWKSNTANIGQAPFKLQLGHDGTISIIDGTNSKIWNSASRNPGK